MTRPRARFMARAKRTLLWSLIRGRALISGQAGKDFSRVREHLQFRTGLEKPDYPEPEQRPRAFFPGLRARGWHDPREFPWIADLEAHYDAIKKEMSALQERSVFRSQHQKLTTEGSWDVYYFYVYGHKIAENCATCPETTKMIESIPGATSAGLVYFSAMAPGTHLQAHYGPTNVRLRCHLGLSIPQGCELRVGSDSRPWVEKTCAIFDDSFDHEVWNRGTGTRIVLIVDTWHPDLLPHEVAAMKLIVRLSNRTRKLQKKLLPH